MFVQQSFQIHVGQKNTESVRHETEIQRVHRAYHQLSLWKHELEKRLAAEHGTDTCHCPRAAHGPHRQTGSSLNIDFAITWDSKIHKLFQSGILWFQRFVPWKKFSQIFGKQNSLDWIRKWQFVFWFEENAVLAGRGGGGGSSTRSTQTWPQKKPAALSADLKSRMQVQWPPIHKGFRMFYFLRDQINLNPTLVTKTLVPLNFDSLHNKPCTNLQICYESWPTSWTSLPCWLVHIGCMRRE